MSKGVANRRIMLLVVPSVLLGLKDNQSDQKKQKCGSKKQAMNGVESLSKKHFEGNQYFKVDYS